MNISDFKNVYFLGIGGIGMSALARYFNHLGKKVAGYDRSESTLTQELIAEGIDIHYDDNNELINDLYKDISNTLVVLTPAIPKEHSELHYFQDNNFCIKKRAEVLGIITNSFKTIAIAGTHGKTTTTTLTAHILKASGFDCSAFLGGISKNYNSNLILSDKLNPRITEEPQIKSSYTHIIDNYVVVEADEYDRSFLQLSPDIGVITSINADHLDIYGTKAEIQKSFIQFTERIKKGGKLILKYGVEIDLSQHKDYQLYTYSLNNENADFYATNIEYKNNEYFFEIITPEKKKLFLLTLGVAGLVNIENAVAASAVAHLLGIHHFEILLGLATFRGVSRRFDYQIKRADFLYIDDYAHHPEELKAFISSVRKMYPEKQIAGIFQPHLYSRTRDFAEEFAQSLSLLDHLILLDIYPAREQPIEGVTSQIIFDKVTINQKVMLNKSELINYLKNNKFEILVTMGAGDIDRFVPQIVELFK